MKDSRSSISKIPKRLRNPYKAEDSTDTSTKVHVPKNKVKNRKTEKQKAIKEQLKDVE